MIFFGEISSLNAGGMRRSALCPPKRKGHGGQARIYSPMRLGDDLMTQTAPEAGISAPAPAFKFINAGKTRVVIFLGPFAIKIAKIGLHHMVERSYQIVRARQVRQKRAAWKRENGQSVVGVVSRALFLGAWANLAKYRLWVNHPHEDLAPTLFTLFYLVNVQRRGTPVETVQPFDFPWLRQIPLRANVREDLDRVEQYCAIGGRICLADYGYQEFEPILTQRKRFTASAH